MNLECRENWEGVVSLAEGQANDRASAHLEECESCRLRFHQLRSMMSGMETPEFEVPSSLVQAAKDLFVGKRRKLGLIRTSLQLSSARAPKQDLQAVFGGEGIEIRVMYSKVEQGWEILGQAPSDHWRVEWEGGTVESDERGRFHFRVETLESSEFSLVGEMEAYEVPSASEAISGLGNDT